MYLTPSSAALNRMALHSAPQTRHAWWRCL